MSMSSDTPVQIAWDEAMTAYDFGRGHPMSPIRLELTTRLAERLGILTRPGVQVVEPRQASDSELATVHEPAYIDAVRAASQDPDQVNLHRGLGTSDVPTFADMHEVSARVVGATVDTSLAVWHGQAVRAANIAGGLHHAMPGLASGFCVYNDIAVAIRALLDAGARRIAYVDVDVHHGDGVQYTFADDPRVLTISLHETPLTLFPGTGYSDDTGGAGAEGSAVNVALPPGTRDAGWLRAFHAVVPPLLRAFAPEILVTQQGCDTHVNDPLANLALTVDGQRESYVALRGLADELCSGRWVAVGGGGYEIIEVVPRAWSHLLATVAGEPIEPSREVPEEWREYVSRRYGRPAPGRMTDGGDVEYRDWDDGFDPAEAVDRAIKATRQAIFPAHGLDIG